MNDKTFSNELSDAQIERLALLVEECAEVQQIIGKILRHGYHSYNPLKDHEQTNKMELTKEVGHLMLAVDFLIEAQDVSGYLAVESRREKRESIKRWLHHQEPTP